MKPPTGSTSCNLLSSSPTDSMTILLQQSISMTEQDSLSTKSDTAVDDATPEDTVSQNHAVSNAVTANAPTPSMASARNWILHLPPELRFMLYSYVLQLPLDIPYYSPSGPWMRALTGLLRTSSLIRSESMDFFQTKHLFSWAVDEETSTSTT